MVIIEILAQKIANRISLQLDYDEDKRDVISYGLIGIFQIFTILIILSFIGLLFDCWYECMIIYMSVGFIRKSTGGAHSRSMNGCIIISVLSIIIMSVLSRYLLNFSLEHWVSLGITYIIFFICLIIFYFKVPMDNPNKPIVSLEKIKRLRKQSFIKLFLLLLVSIVFTKLADSYSRFYSIAFSVRLTMLWLVLTLSRPGFLFLDKIDSIIDFIIGKFND